MNVGCKLMLLMLLLFLVMRSMVFFSSVAVVPFRLLVWKMNNVGQVDCCGSC